MDQSIVVYYSDPSSNYLLACGMRSYCCKTEKLDIFIAA